jgi:hypothetical protein
MITARASVLRILTGLLIALSGPSLFAKKMITGIDAVILSADLIVVGVIEHNGSGTYSFRVDRTVYGDTSLHSISVVKWKEWTCDTRMFKIQRGQQLVLLLSHDEKGFHPINASTGEIPVEKDSIVLRYEERVHVPYESHPYRLTVQEFCDGVTALLHCCKLQGELGYFHDPIWTCSDDERTTVRKKEDFAAWLYRRVELRKRN